MNLLCFFKERWNEIQIQKQQEKIFNIYIFSKFVYREYKGNYLNYIYQLPILHQII